MKSKYNLLHKPINVYQLFYEKNLILWLLMFILCKPAYAEMSSAAFVEYGEKLRSKGNYEASITAFDKAISLDPKNSKAFHLRADSWIHVKNFDKAMDDVTEAIKLNTDIAWAYGNRGALWYFKKEYKKALSDFTEALKRDKSNAAMWNNHGEALRSLKQFDEALPDFSQAIKLNPKYAYPYNNRALVYYKKGESDKALKDINKALSIDPKYATAYSNRGAIEKQKGDLDQALSDFDKAIQLKPNFAAAINNRGEIWAKKGDYDRALKAYNEALSYDSKDADAFNNRGEAWLKSGSLDNAVNDFKMAIEIDPDYENAKENLKMALAKKNSQLRLIEKNIEGSKSTPSIDDRKGRIALVIGNSRYQEVPELLNPVFDAQIISKTLKEVGFNDVRLRLDQSRSQMISELKDFENAASHADWALIYYAGHGVEISGVNYIIPVDAQARDERQISTQTVNMEYFLNSVQTAKGFRLVILDACRNNPFIDEIHKASDSRGLSGGSEINSNIGRGLSRVEPEPGTLVVYSAKHGDVALDGEGTNSPFATSLVKRMLQKPPNEIRRLFDFVRKDVYESTEKKQQPFAYGSLEPTEDFYFDPK